LATQNPGDIDYKMLGNIRCRFLGKLRAQNDIAKVSVGLGLSQLKEQLAQTTAGEFIYTDEVQNTTQQFKTRWLYSYHCGPLSPADVARINTNDKTKPSDTLKKTPIVEKRLQPIQSKTQSVQQLVQAFQPYTTNIEIKKTDNKDIYKPLVRIVGVIDQQTFVGPYTFDLSTKLIHEKTIRTQGVIQGQGTEQIVQVQAQIPKLVEYVIGFGLAKIPQLNFQSTITPYSSPLFDAVVEHNKAHVNSIYEKKRQHILENFAKKMEILSQKQKIIEQRISTINSRKFALTTSRVLKRLFTTRKIQSSTKQQQQLSKTKETLTKQKNAIVDQKKKITAQQTKAIELFEKQVQKICETKVKKIFTKAKPERITLKVTIILT
jgi:hypothetical protein